MQARTSSHGLWLRRVAWLILLWVGGVVVVGIFAMLLRLLMNAAGMTV